METTTIEFLGKKIENAVIVEKTSNYHLKIDEKGIYLIREELHHTSRIPTVKDAIVSTISIEHIKTVLNLKGE